MLSLMLPATDDLPAVELGLEHTLVSLSKWESIHEKAFFSNEAKTIEETISYIEQMLLTPTKPPANFGERLLATPTIIGACNEHINSKQSATFFREEPNSPKSREIVTSELIYYWLIQFSIPFECENWHINRLMTLIKICGIKQSKPKRMSKQAMAEQYRNLNAERREKLGTTG